MIASTTRGAGVRYIFRCRTAPPLIAHRRDLDGLRGLAIALVLIEHFARSIVGVDLGVAPGAAGVTVFFVLSGYLITSLLQREERIDLRNFYLRRVVRLAPALVVLIAVMAIVGIVARLDWLPGVIAALTYSTNWFVGWGDLRVLGQTWSLAIEEQFYLVWPIAMVLAPRRLLLPVAIAGAAVGTALYSGATYYSTLTNGGAILAGCALALSGVTLPRIAGLLGLALIIVGATFSNLHAGVVMGALLLMAGPIRALEPLAPLGLRAYGLYLWNSPCMLFLGPVGIVPTVVIAEASYRLLETPLMRRYRARLAPRVSPGNRPVSFSRAGGPGSLASAPSSPPPSGRASG